MSKIEWTGKTWNPVVGCTIHSSGCKGCYAMKDAYRLMHNPNARIAEKFAGTARMVNGHAVWTGKLNLSEDALLAPLRRRTPTTWFVNSMSDLFHEDMPVEWIDRIFAVMGLCPQHTFQVLTKRAVRMRAYLSVRKAAAPINVPVGDGTLGQHPFNDELKPPANVWIGVSIEDQRAADGRILQLLKTPAAVRFLSCEPLIGSVDLKRVCIGEGDVDQTQPHAEGLKHVRFNIDALKGVQSFKWPALDWVICGGESGSTARPMHPDWARSLRDQCDAAGVPFFFKQWGEWAPGENAIGPATRTEQTAEWDGERWFFSSLTPRMSEELHYDDAPDVYRLGKKACGRWLDGVEHNGMPV